MANSRIENKLRLLPDLPGCYLMKDRQGKIIYIGKAKNLKNRVRSYFKSSHTGKTAQLVSAIDDFETIVTHTNKESLLLEINLIQKYQPHYNIKLKEGTMYPYLKITKERNPQLLIASVVESDGALYFGPYPNVRAATGTRDLLQKIYPLRRCSKQEKRACFYYHLGQCIGCCDHEISPKTYEKQIKKITRFLKGDVATIKADLKQKMTEAAATLQYERAADYRDQIRYIEQTVEPQNVMSKAYNNRDVFAYYMAHGWISIQVFMLRQFSIIKRDSSLFPCYSEPEEAFISYIMQFYQDKAHTKPKEILLPDGVDHETLREALAIKVATPKRGQKHKLLTMAMENAKIAHEQRFRLEAMNEARTQGAISELSKALKIPYARVIESFDHSNHQGVDAVSGMVYYEDGKPNKKQYRKYKIKTVTGANEYDTTQEVIRRRYSRLLKEGQPLPDLILMDGGAIEIHACQEVLVNELGLTDLPVAGMVKDDKHKTAKLIYDYGQIGGNLIEVPLDPKSNAFYLIQRIQTEVDRYAKSYHHQLHHKTSFASRLETIRGVGPKTRAKVMRHFKTLKRIRQADIKEIEALGIARDIAEAIQAEAQK